MDRLIDTRCTTGNRKAMIHYLISFPPCNSQPPYINVLSASSFLGIHYTIVIPFFPFFFLFLSNSRRKFFRIITQKKGKSNKFRNLVQVQTTSRRNAIEIQSATAMYAKCNRCRIHLPKNTFFFFVLFGSVKISIWNDDGERKRKTLHHTGVKSSAQPEGGERIKNQLI